MKQKDKQHASEQWNVEVKLSGVALKLTDHESTFKSLHA